MKPKDFDKIRELATEFRSAIDNWDPEKLPVGLIQFPRGACGNACLLLAKFLQRHGYDGFDYVSGDWGEQSHAWLEKKGVIVDITADQFGGHLPPVVVTKDRSWHARFRVEDRHHSDFEKYDCKTVKTLKLAYNQIVEAKYRIT